MDSIFNDGSVIYAHLQSYVPMTHISKKLMEPSPDTFTIKRRTSTLRWIMLVMALSGLVMLAGGVIWASLLDRNDRLLKNEGMPARAQVISKEIDTDSEGYDTYTITYSFTALPGEAGEKQIKQVESISEAF